jgi:transcription elongation factor GreA
MEKIPMTREGFNKMTEQFQHMRNVEFKECLQALSDARDKGDISENAEYEVAKQALYDLNLRIQMIYHYYNP